MYRWMYRCIRQTRLLCLVKWGCPALPEQSDCLILVYYCYNETLWLKESWAGKGLLGLCFQILVYLQRKSEQKQARWEPGDRRSWGHGLMQPTTVLFSMTCSGPPDQWWLHSPWAGSSPIKHYLRKWSTGFPTAQFNRGLFSSGTPSFQTTLACVRLVSKQPIHLCWPLQHLHKFCGLEVCSVYWCFYV